MILMAMSILKSNDQEGIMYKQLLLCAGIVFLSSGLRAMESMKEDDENEWVLIDGESQQQQDDKQHTIGFGFDSGAASIEASLLQSEKLKHKIQCPSQPQQQQLSQYPLSSDKKSVSPILLPLASSLISSAGSPQQNQIIFAHNSVKEIIQEQTSQINASSDIRLLSRHTLEPEDDDEDEADPFHLMAKIGEIGDIIQEATQSVGNRFGEVRESFSRFIELLSSESDNEDGQ
jgi:hypothetical protein